MPLRVLVVDDTTLFRKVVGQILTELPDVEVVGTANNGRTALNQISELKPDLVTLDIEMPEMNGIEVLEALNQRQLDVGVIVLSAITVRGGELTIKALELGAFDFITKPTSGTMEENRQALKNDLMPKVKAFGLRRGIRSILKGLTGPAPAIRPVAAIPVEPPIQPRVRPRSFQTTKPELVVIGVSTGGPNALAAVVPRLPADLGVPLLIVQHMPALFTQSLAESLRAKSKLKVREAKDGEAALPGTAYIAPGGRQMKVGAGPAGEKILRITDDPPENFCKPAVDYLFRSVAQNYPGRATAVIMTGMGSDGTQGLRLIKAHGGLVIAQDEATCVVFGMPKEAIGAGVVDLVVPLDSIATEIVRSVKGMAA